MCVSVAPAEFSGTILYVGRREHPDFGPIEVLGYQNTAVNLTTGPNAMLLHLPALAMTRANFLDTTSSPDVLRDLVDALSPASRGTAAYGAVAAGPPPAVEVFDHDVYTVVLAADPRDIPAALDRVPEHKRPRLRPELFTFYAEVFPDYPVALCCFDNADARRAAPLLMWYRPVYLDRLIAPALDCHTGEAPEPNGWVRPDHWVVFGIDDVPGEWGSPVTYRQPPGPLAAFLPERVIGRAVQEGPVRNGDFVLGLQDARAERIEALARLTPNGERVSLDTAPLPEPVVPGPETPTRSGPAWLKPLLLSVVVALFLVSCFIFLVWGP